MGIKHKKTSLKCHPEERFSRRRISGPPERSEGSLKRFFAALRMTVALEAARVSAETAGTDSRAMLDAVSHGVDRALEEFKNKPCRQGRARIFAEKSARIYDPGMVVIKRMTEGLAA